MSWGNGNKGPWGNAPGGGGDRGPRKGGGKQTQPPSPDLDEWLRKGQEQVRGLFGGGDGENSGRVIILAGLVIALFWLGSGVYRVNPDELGVVLRFGEYHRTSGPGLNYHFPYPVETVLIPSVTTVNKEEVGFRTAVSRASASSGFDKESLMLTGDRNIVDVDFEVQWKIDATVPQDYLFNVRDPSHIIKPAAESAMREVIGRSTLSDVLTTAQSQIAEDTREIMQSMLDDYQAGIEVIAVNLSRPDVPTPVIDEFQDVKRAEQDRETAESVAEGYRNEILPKAKGMAVQMVQKAEAYKNKVVADAQGDAARFISVYNQYKLAEEVTRKRIYLETMEVVMHGMNKVILDGRAGQGVLPYLPLKSLTNSEK